MDYDPIIVLNMRVDHARRSATLEALGRGVTYMCMADDDIETETDDAFSRLVQVLRDKPGAFAAVGHVCNKTGVFKKAYQPPDNMVRQGGVISLCGFALSVIRMDRFLKISDDPNQWWTPACYKTGRGEDTKMAVKANRAGYQIFDDIQVWGRHWELAVYRGVMAGHDVKFDRSYAEPHGFTVYSRSGIDRG